MSETTVRPCDGNGHMPADTPEAPEDDLAGVDWLEVSEAIRSLSLTYIAKAFDWLGESIKAGTYDGTTVIFAAAACNDDGVASDAIGEVLMAYERAAVTL